MPPRPPAEGAFTIVLEGVDGSGTSSQMRPLARHLRAAGHPVACRKEPSSGPTGRLLRRFLAGSLPLDPAPQALLFAADRLTLRAGLSPAAFTGGTPGRRRVLLLDRGVWSSLAYQGGALPAAWLWAINHHCPVADLTLYFRLPLSEAARRRQQRGGPAEVFDAPPVQAAVARRYAQLVASRARRQRVAVLDASQGMAEVTRAARQACDGALGQRARRAR